MSAKRAISQVNWAHFIAGQAGVIPLSLGIPGVAKTETHRALAAAVGRHFRSVCLDQVLPEDLGGYPTVQELPDHLDPTTGHHYKVMARVHDERFVRCKLEPSVLLIDELTNTGHATQASALQLMAEGIESCWIFSAANPVDKAAAGVDLAPPMVNRLCILEWETDLKSIRQGWRDNLDFPAPSLPILPADWRNYCAKWGALMDKFADAIPTLIEKYPKDAHKATEPYPTPRSWTNVIKLLGAAESVGANNEVRSKLVWGCVGQAAGTEFLTWLSKQDLPDPEAILNDPTSLNLPKRGDHAMAIVASVWNRIQHDNTPDRWEAGFDVLEHVHSQIPEIAQAAHGSLWKIKPVGYTPKKRKSKLTALVGA